MEDTNTITISKDLLKSQLQYLEKETAKRTAEKIFKELYAYSKRHTWMCLSPEDIETFADKYGVEVEE